MSRMAALSEPEHSPTPLQEQAVREEAFLPLQIAACAEATSRLIASGLAKRAPSATPILVDETGALRPEIASIARDYEAALLAGLSPAEVKTLRRLLAKVEAAALKLSGRERRQDP